ncbi:hypothetical protein [Desulfoluna sp.]|uniref:hypothetical protein n=1 Tax=Desulfoluna sp. TaxID=2045199 RepID=UPI00260B3332|nr:hypothetical protein [Desulfoluna sp.]
MDYPQLNQSDTLVLIRMEVAGALQIWVEESQRPAVDNGTRAPHLFHISFPGEIMALSNLNASYVRTVDNDTGAVFQVFKTSPFLDYVRTETYAASTMEHPLQHFRLITEENLIDVITLTPPHVDEITLE